MNKLFFILLLLLSGLTSFASHIYGGEMVYEYISSNATTNSKKYKITLRLFRDNDGGGAPLPETLIIGIFDYATKKHYPATSTGYTVSKTSGPTVVDVKVSPCITGSVRANYSVATYSVEVDLPNNSDGYICAFETCCRVNNLNNVYHPGGGPGSVGGTGSTYVCKIPGSTQVPVSGRNSSPQFVTSLDLVCYEKAFRWDFSAVDADGDELQYSFFDGYNKTTAPDANPIPPAAPSFGGIDYPLLQYVNGYSSSKPLGANASIDSKTGIISGIAPPQGLYVVCVLIKEFRNGKLIGEHLKDFILNVRVCDFSGAQLKPTYSACDDFNYSFQNLNNSPLNNTFYWDFGVQNSTDDFSTAKEPTFSYPDTGTYTLKLVINRDAGCSDSSTALVKVYPGFFPNFDVEGICVTKPTKFLDKTISKYGRVDSWQWNFGDNNNATNESTEASPSHIYSQIGNYNAGLIVSSTKGCVDTIFKDISIIDKPPLTLAFNDTLICNGDALQLQAIGNGNFSWQPAGNISNANSATPTVRPTSTTSYTVQLNDNGCINQENVQVRVVNSVSLTTIRDTTICLTDAVQLNAQSNGLRYEWSPAATLSNTNILNPVATPTGTTSYQVTAIIGNCSATKTVTVRTVPYPAANAGNDVVLCYGEETTLNANFTGNSFSWLNGETLSDAFIVNPIARPLSSTAYILNVLDNKGCPKPGLDTVLVTVLPKIKAFAGNDTAAVVGQSLQLVASGGIKYEWSPATALNNPNIANPVANYDGSFENIQYKVIVGNENGCFDSAYVSVKVFKTNPRIYVPTAFTPNGDGLNSIFRPIPVGISRIESFQVFNRWGQLVFSSADVRGWDGKIGGKEQPTGTYVWLVKGIDYTGKVFTDKGTVLLLR